MLISFWRIQEIMHHCHFQNDLPDDSYSAGRSSFQIIKFIPFFENRQTITTVFDMSLTVTRFLSDRRFARFRPLADSPGRASSFRRIGHSARSQKREIEPARTERNLPWVKLSIVALVYAASAARCSARYMRARWRMAPSSAAIRFLARPVIP
jgi:hypothetical protein